MGVVKIECSHHPTVVLEVNTSPLAKKLAS